jgi:hypothetical protein
MSSLRNRSEAKLKVQEFAQAEPAAKDRFVQERGCLHPQVVQKIPVTFGRMWASALLFCHFLNSL